MKPKEFYIFPSRNYLAPSAYRNWGDIYYSGTGEHFSFKDACKRFEDDKDAVNKILLKYIKSL